MLIKVIRKECDVEQLKKAIEEKQLSKIDEMRKTKKQLKVSYTKLSNCSITERLRKLCNCLLVLDPTFFKSLRKMKEKQAEIFATNCLKNYVIGSLDIKNYIFG